jgi:hypothetical protein
MFLPLINHLSAEFNLTVFDIIKKLYLNYVPIILSSNQCIRNINIIISLIKLQNELKEL